MIFVEFWLPIKETLIKLILIWLKGKSCHRCHSYLVLWPLQSNLLLRYQYIQLYMHLRVKEELNLYPKQNLLPYFSCQWWRSWLLRWEYVHSSVHKCIWFSLRKMYMNYHTSSLTGFFLLNRDRQFFFFFHVLFYLRCLRGYVLPEKPNRHMYRSDLFT